MLVFINACRLLSALLSLSQFGQARLSLVEISFYALSLIFGPCRLSEFTLAGPLDANTGFPKKRSPRNKRRNSILMTCHYPVLGCASGWWCGGRNLFQPIRLKCTTDIWAVILHQCRISALFPQNSALMMAKFAKPR